MAQELGHIDRPSAAAYQGRRKLLLVPLLFGSMEAPLEFAERLDRYWQGVSQHLSNLASTVGDIDRIFHEMIATSGEEGLKMLQLLSPRSHQIVQGECEKGAELTATDDRELLQETIDWQRCLMIGLASPTVAQQVYDSYQESSRKRYEHIAHRIDESLEEEQVGILFIGEDHRVQFASDIEVFYVAPPALNEIHRWLRDYSGAATQAESEEPSSETSPAEGDASSQA